MKVLMSTSEWPTEKNPFAAPFVVRQVEYLRSRGIEVEVFHFRGGGNPLNYWKANRSYKKVEKAFVPDIVHAQWGQSALAALPKSAPLVITYRGDDLEGVINSQGKYGLKSFVLKRVGRFVARFADARIVVSPHLIPKLPKAYRKATVIPSGLELDKMPKQSKAELKSELGLDPNKKVVIFPNNPDDPRKNIALIEKALSQLPEEERSSLDFRVAYGLKHAEILRQLKAADFLFFASIHEGSPNVVKEALANDVAVVSVPVGDVPERLEPIPGCFVSESYSVDHFTAAIKKALAFDYSSYVSRPYVEPLEESLLVEKLIAIYKSLLS